MDKEEHQEINSQGSKRIRTKEVEEIKLEKDQENRTRPGKKRRESSPEGNQIKWRLRPTFLDLKRREDEEKEGRVNGKEDKEEKKEENKPNPEKEIKKERETEPENEKEEGKSAEEIQKEARTPVRERVRKLNKKAAASPGKFPLMKQQMLDLYFRK